MPADQRLLSEQIPRSMRYNPDWLIASASGGANPLWLTEWLTTAMGLKPGARVLDLGCGRAVSSIFLHREFGVQVWATDLWISASENMQQVRDAGVDDGVYPIHADARLLPFATDFFDAILCIDSFPYFGTDDLYLNYLAQFLKPGSALVPCCREIRQTRGDLCGAKARRRTPAEFCLVDRKRGSDLLRRVEE